MAKGKFIVLYGINNLGKSTQAKILIEKLNQQGIKAEYLKYPVYGLEPTGPQINQILRGGEAQKITEEELQTLYTQNRRDYEPTLKQKLESGIWIVAEDYTGTGIAWGNTKGASLEFLENLNKDLLKEDLGILFIGERFLEGKEEKHIHESNDELMNRCALTHKMLGERYGWKTINANQPKEKVQEDLWDIIDIIID